MCLDRKVEFKPCKRGYRVLAKGESGTLYSSLFGNFSSQPLGKWLDEKDYREINSPDKIIIEETCCLAKPYWEFYPVGWHIFHTLRAARNWLNDFTCPHCAVKVEVQKPVATGYQDKCKVTVAKKIKILKIVEEIVEEANEREDSNAFSVGGWKRMGISPNGN